MSPRKLAHIRLTCPHCGKDVSVQRPHGFQRAVPCSHCRIPIAVDYILAAEEEATTKANGKTE